MEKLFLPLDLTIAISKIEGFDRIEEIASWDNTTSEFLQFYGAGCTKAITWYQGLRLLLRLANMENDFHELFIQFESYENIDKLVCKRTVHARYYEDLAEGKENIFYKLLELSKLA